METPPVHERSTTGDFFFSGGSVFVLTQGDGRRSQARACVYVCVCLPETTHCYWTLTSSHKQEVMSAYYSITRSCRYSNDVYINTPVGSVACTLLIK